MYNKSKLFKIAHSIRTHFKTFGQALKTAWALLKISLGRITSISFEKKNTGEVRTAKIERLFLGDVTNGAVKFIEILENGQTQIRSFRVELLKL